MSFKTIKVTYDSGMIKFVSGRVVAVGTEATTQGNGKLASHRPTSLLFLAEGECTDGPSKGKGWMTFGMLGAHQAQSRSRLEEGSDGGRGPGEREDNQRERRSGKKDYFKVTYRDAGTSV